MAQTTRLQFLALVRRVIGVTIMAIFLYPVLAFAAGSQPMRFDHLSLDEGLSQSTVMVMYQDSRGYMWFGTENGLNRYDGYNFYQYKRESGNLHALSSDFVRDILEDADGNLWIATDDGGVARWNRSTDQFTTFRTDPQNDATLSSNMTQALSLFANGELWIGTRHSGIDRMNINTFHVDHFRHDPHDPGSLSSDEIYVMYRDRAGQLWIGSNGGLNRYDRASGQFVLYQNDPDDASSLSDNRVRSIFEDRNGALWVGTRGGGLNHLDRNSGKFTRYQHDPEDESSLANNRVKSIYEDSAGRMWIGTAHGLNLMDRKLGRFTRYVHDAADPDGLSDSYVMSLFEDNAGILWVGTRAGGVSKWNPRSWAFGHFATEQMSTSAVASFVVDDTGRLWVGTFGGGLNIIDRANDTVTHFLHDPADPKTISGDRVMAVIIDHEGMIWAGTMSGGLNRIDPATGTAERFRHDPKNPASLSADGVMAIFEDSTGNIWVGTYGGGINRFDRDSRSFVRYMHDPADATSLSSPRATSLAETTDGAIWIGTDGGGLNVLEPTTGKLRSFMHNPNNPTSLSADTVYALHVDARGTLWIGTQGGGLDRLDNPAIGEEQIGFHNVSHADGLANDVIYGIQSDSSGSIWLSSNHGLTRYDPETHAIQNFHRSHGLQGEEFNFGAHYRSSEGELFFGGANGFNAFSPTTLPVNNQKPPIVLTGFTKLNQPVDTEVPYGELDEIGLGYQDDVVTFEFAALDFTSPEENKYAYMLEGFDKDWVELDNRRHVTYTNLNDGNYVFRVIAANSDGVWNRNGLALPVSVTPAPWDTWWAYVLYAATIIGLLALIAQAQRVKLKREAEYSRRLELEVRNRTEELASRNAELAHVNTRLHEASFNDPLTGLRNRRFVFQEVSKEIDLVRRDYRAVERKDNHELSPDLVFMMVDLDHFKPVNDTCGHAAGDQILLQVRDVLQQACRNSDFIVRWGGDEFLVIGRHAHPDQTEALADRIRTSIAQTVFALGDGQVVRTTCSIGFACFPFVRSNPDLLSWEQVLGLADDAMYVAKTNRNAWVGYLSSVNTAEHADLLTEIRNAPDELEETGALDIRCSFPRTNAACG